MLSFIIPSRTDEYLDRLLESFMQTTADARSPEARPQILVIDNGVSDDLKARWLADDVFGCKFELRFLAYANPAGFVFAAAMNQGIREAPANAHVVLMNDDTVVETPGFVEKLEAAADDPAFVRLGLISPQITGGVGNPEQSPELDPVTAETPVGAVRLSSNVVCFVCALIPRRALESVGLLDEAYIYYGFDDADYCRRLVDADFLLGVLGGCRVRHVGFSEETPGSGSYRRYHGLDNQTALFYEAQKVFHAKFGPGPQLGSYRAARELLLPSLPEEKAWQPAEPLFDDKPPAAFAAHAYEGGAQGAACGLCQATERNPIHYFEGRPILQPTPETVSATNAAGQTIDKPDAERLRKEMFGAGWQVTWPGEDVENQLGTYRRLEAVAALAHHEATKIWLDEAQLFEKPTRDIAAFKQVAESLDSAVPLCAHYKTRQELLTGLAVPNEVEDAGRYTDLESDVDLLWALVTRLNPKVSVEFGTRQAVSTKVIASALQTLDRGAVFFACDPDPACRQFVAGIESVVFMEMTGEQFLDMQPDEFKLNFAFFDVDPHSFDQTTHFLGYFEKYLAVGGCVALHDVIKNRPEIAVREAVEAFVAVRPGWRFTVFPLRDRLYRWPQGGLGLLWRLA